MQINTYTDYMTEVYDWLQFVTGIADGRIFRGNQSREVLPADNNYVVYTPITQKRIGTNIAILHAENVDADKNAPSSDEKLLQIDLQVDCYGDNAFSYAEGIETFARSLRCNEWLRQSDMGMRVLYASDPMDGTMIDDTEQYVTRWIVTLSICIMVSNTDLIPWIEDVQVNVIPKQEDTPSPTPSEQTGDKLINVDVVYPPEKE